MILLIHAIQILAQEMEFAEWLMELHLATIPSVYRMKIVLQQRLATARDVKIHAWMHVESMLSVTSSTTMPFAHAPTIILALRSLSAELCKIQFQDLSVILTVSAQAIRHALTNDALALALTNAFADRIQNVEFKHTDQSVFAVKVTLEMHNSSVMKVSRFCF